MTNDPIADMLTRMRNAIARSKRNVSMPSSKMLESIAAILEKEGFVNSSEVKEIEGNPQKELTIELKYVNGVSAITSLKRISKPGLRIYLGYKDIPKVRNGLGIAVISTSKGVMAGNEARKDKIGGELLAEIW